MYDLILKNGNIIDGTGSPAYLADLAIVDGKIVRIGQGLTGAKQEIDATGLTVTPGFIDSHSHSDSTVLTYPDQIEKIEQGITISIAGQCGTSPAPISRDITPDKASMIGEFGLDTDIYRTMGSFLQTAKNVPQGSHIAILVGHCALRLAVMGMENREPTADELEKMKSLLREGMDNGALGVSFGLIYPPSCYAKTDELIELAKVVSEYHGIVAAHIRNEGDFVVKSTNEFITIIKESGARGVISHHKSAGFENWGKVTHTLRMIDAANANGAEIYCDVYPYGASHTSVGVRFVPKEYHAMGLKNVLSDPELRKKIRQENLDYFGPGLDWVLVTSCDAYPEVEGKTLAQIAREWNKDEYETTFDLVRDSGKCQACFFNICEEDIETVMAYPRAMICTDSGVARNNTVYHPRLRGTFPRALGRYVRERGVVTLPEMIRKMTSMPAAVYGLTGKGLLREGFDADICIFDPDKIIDRAEYTDCSKRAEGLNYVILGGEVVVEDAVYNGKRMGKVILKNTR
ncbi:MAG: D-aminoacylase [Lachnospiraceae bacterium]|nr:D-aminoacylase [Lachnospiraceae bacterium]